jgi:hypothetical protein
MYHLHDSVIARLWATFSVPILNSQCCYICDFLEMSTSYASTVQDTTYSILAGNTVNTVNMANSLPYSQYHRLSRKISIISSHTAAKVGLVRQLSSARQCEMPFRCQKNIENNMRVTWMT